MICGYAGCIEGGHGVGWVLLIGASSQRKFCRWIRSQPRGAVPVPQSTARRAVSVCRSHLERLQPGVETCSPGLE